MNLVSKPISSGFSKKCHRSLWRTCMFFTHSCCLCDHRYFSHFHIRLEIDLFNHFSQLLKFYAEFSLLPRPWCSNHTSHTVNLYIQWLRLVPSLIFPMSFALSLITFDRSQAHTTKQLACQEGWRSCPRPKFLVAELVFLCFTKPLIENNTWILTCLKCLQVLA